MDKKIRNAVYLLKVLLGLDEKWKKQFDVDAAQEVENLKENFAQKGMYPSGMRKSQVNLLKMERKRSVVNNEEVKICLQKN